MASCGEWYLLILLLILGTAPAAWAQPTVSPIQARRDSLIAALEAQGTSSICFYTDGCTGCRSVPEPSCESPGTIEPTFAFWQYEGRTYRLYLGHCRLQPAQVVATDLWPYISRHQKALRNEKIRPFHQGPFFSPRRIHRNHGGWQEVEIVLPNDTIRQSIDDFDVSSSTRSFGGEGTMRNIYFRHNKRTHIYQLLQLLRAAAEGPAATQAAGKQ